MRIEDAITKDALQARPRQDVFAAEGMIDADEVVLQLCVVAARALHLSIEGVLYVLRGLELILVPFDRLQHELGIHFFEGHDLNVAVQG